MYYQIPPSYEPLKPFPWSLETCFKSELKYYGVKLNFKLASFSKDNGRIPNTDYLTTNTSSQNISHTFYSNLTNIEEAIGGESSRELYWLEAGCR